METINNESEQKMETKNEISKTETNETNSDLGQSEEITIAERIEKANLEMKKSLEFKAKLLEKEERILARQEVLRALGGGSPAGLPTPKPAEKTAREYAEDVLAGKIRAN